MKKIGSTLIILLTLSSCSQLFKINDTEHSLQIINDTDSSVEFVWSTATTSGFTLLEPRTISPGQYTSRKSASANFLTQDGNRPDLEISELYENFTKLVVLIDLGEGLKKEVEIEPLQIEPFVGNDHFWDTQTWYYQFKLTNEDLE